MCGIVGAVALDGRPLPPLDEPIARIAHRGPDDVGLWTDGLCALGFRRLAIIDLSDAGHQPMTTGDERLWIVFNGEIYNYNEVRRDLESTGHVFRSASDTEVILHAYQRWGASCLDRLNGMFALAIWNRADRSLFVARDRVGKKPLFYCIAGGRFVFASELQALLADPAVRREPDLTAIDQYLSWGYVPAPRTGFVGVSKLTPGHHLRISPGSPEPKIERWWHLPYRPKLDLDVRAAQAELRDRLTDAVRLRMISDVPIGAFLSGGIDSSIVVGLMASLTGDPVKTFSIGFEESGYDELPHARRVAERFGTDHHEVVVRPDALAVLPMLVRHFGEPFADSSAIPTYYVSQVARSGVTVALNGDGGDESFGGYERYVGAILSERIAAVPGSGMATRLAARLLPAGTDQKSRLRTAARFLSVANQPLRERYRRWQGYFDADAKAALYGDTLRPHLGRSPDWFDELFDTVDDGDALDTVMAADVFSYLPYDLLVKVDIASMARSLEARSPLLDHRVMELAARLPGKYKVRGRRTKAILVDAFADLLPAENVNRRKMGFGVPVGSWFRGPLRELLLDALAGPEARGRGLFDTEAALRLANDHLERRTDHTSLLWSLLMLELWHREMVDAARPASASLPG